MISLLRQKLLYQVYIIIITLMTMIMLIIGYLVLQEQERTILDVMRTQAQTLAKSIELVSSDAMVTDDQSFLVEHNLNVLSHSPTIHFITISKNGGSALLTRQNEWELRQSIPIKLKSMEQKSEYSAIIPSPYGPSKEKIYYYTYPLNFDGIAWGWIHIGFSLDNLNHAYNAVYNEILTLFFIVFVILSIAIFFLSRYIVRPITSLSIATNKMANGELDLTLNTTRSDEIGELTRNFNAMAESLLKSQKALRNNNLLLEQKVEERTQELEEINRTLDERVRQEISARREQEQILIQQSRFAAMGEMIGNIAHQWRQPLNALSLLIQNVNNAYETDTLSDPLMQRLSQKGNLLITTMSTTIDDFRNFFKPNRTKEHFYLSGYIIKALDMLQASFNNHEIHVTVELDETLTLEGFPNEFSQVILNILNNAKDAFTEHTHQGKTITIRSYEHNNILTLDIQDNAGGIAPEIIDKIFDPYFTTKEEGKGTGIGLYMSKVIIENNMHGKLTVHNTDNGAIFSIKLPCNGIKI